MCWYADANTLCRSPLPPSTCRVDWQLWQLKIPITAILFRILLNKPLTSLKWCALALLFSGVLTTQSSNPEIISQLATGSSSGRATGVLLVLVGVFVSAFAGVYTEWVLKRRAQHNFFVQNAMLYSWGVFFNLVGLVTRDLDRVMRYATFMHCSSTPCFTQSLPCVYSDGLFIGCTWICPPIVVINAAVGFSYAGTSHTVTGCAVCRVAKLTFPTLLFTDSGVQIRGQHCHAVRSRSVHVDHRPFLVAPVRPAPEPRIAVWVRNVYSLLMAVSCRLAVASVRASLFVAHSYHHKPEAATTLAARDGGAR